MGSHGTRHKHKDEEPHVERKVVEKDRGIIREQPVINQGPNVPITNTFNTGNVRNMDGQGMLQPGVVLLKDPIVVQAQTEFIDRN